MSGPQGKSAKCSESEPARVMVGRVPRLLPPVML